MKNKCQPLITTFVGVMISVSLTGCFSDSANNVAIWQGIAQGLQQSSQQWNQFGQQQQAQFAAPKRITVEVPHPQFRPSAWSLPTVDELAAPR